jgi:hypothetical protein
MHRQKPFLSFLIITAFATTLFLPAVTPAAEIIMDDEDGIRNGNWFQSKWAPQYIGLGYHWHAAGTGTDTFLWRITTAGTYEVFARWTTSPSGEPDTTRADDATYTIFHVHGSTAIKVNQQSNGGVWVTLGTYSFDGVDDYVELVQSASGIVIADAIRWELQP